jgi:hypothetical protein
MPFAKRATFERIDLASAHVLAQARGLWWILSWWESGEGPSVSEIQLVWTKPPDIDKLL